MGLETAVRDEHHAAPLPENFLDDVVDRVVDHPFSGRILRRSEQQPRRVQTSGDVRGSGNTRAMSAFTKSASPSSALTRVRPSTNPPRRATSGATSRAPSSRWRRSDTCFARFYNRIGSCRFSGAVRWVRENLAAVVACEFQENAPWDFTTPYYAAILAELEAGELRERGRVVFRSDSDWLTISEQQVTAPSALASSDTSTVTRSRPRSARRSAVRG